MTTDPAATLRIMTYNILDGGEDFFPEISNIVRQTNPDVLAVQEANDETLFYNLASELGFEAALAEGNRGFHVGLLSRYPITSWVNHPDKGIFHHTFLEAHLETPFGALAAFIVHLRPGYETFEEEKRVQEVNTALGYMQPYAKGLSFLAGDFNTMSPQDILNLSDWPQNWQIHLRLRGGELPREAISQVLAAGYTDCYRSLYPAPGPEEDPANSRYRSGYTLPAYKPNIRLDYIFASAQLARGLYSCEVVTAEGAHKASDHLPVVAEFRFS